MTTMEELLNRGAADVSRQRPGRHGVWWLLRATVGSAVAAAAMVAAAYAAGFRLWYPLAFVAVLAAVVLHRAVARLPAVPVGDLRPRAERDEPAPPDGLARALRRWRARVSWDQAGLWHSSRTLHASLAELVDERLRQRRGITRASDPAGARAALGDRLWSYLDRPPHQAPSPRHLSALVGDVERI